MLFLSSAVWSDSDASLKQRFKYLNIKNKSKVISYIPRALKKNNSLSLEPNFIFWGRVGAEKGLDRALIIFSKVVKFYNNASFLIIGPDGGELENIKLFSKKLGVFDKVKFYDAMDIDEIYDMAKNASFYIQTSKFEGMALSVVEAMQIGLVPVVTPVGEISSYCNEDNAIIVHSNDEAVRDILLSLESLQEFKTKSNNANSTWLDSDSYEDSFFKECNKVINHYE